MTYPQNPRVVETNVRDSDGNRKRVTMDYGVGYNLPTAVREWGGPNYDQLLRLTTTAYKTDAAYINNRVIGLPYERVIYDGPTGAVKARVVYQYDWGGNDPWGDEYISSQTPSTNYTDPGYVQGRGNLIGVVRYDCTNNSTAYNDSLAIWVRLSGYNKAGSVVWTKDNFGHKTSLSYADSFSDGNNGRNTYAYPTSVTDPEGYSSTTQYNYDFGAPTLQHVPTSGTGAGVTYVNVASEFDAHGRMQKLTNQTNNTYKKWVYDANYIYSHTYETITGVTTADEFHSWQIFDGAGRVWASASDHPGSANGFAGQYVTYDNMGRVIYQSNRAEINASWVPSGDDSAGWAYTGQAYDWKGRPVQTTNPDGTTRVNSYGGCGCAGGAVTTAQDEHGRKWRYTEDVLGRTVKAEEFDWYGSVYSTSNYTHDVLDRLTQISQAGQSRTFEYDGHGRLWRRTTPEQGAITTVYNSDDTPASLTDARGAKANFGYNARHLTTSVSYDLSGVLAGQNVAATRSVTYAYDAAGNRTSMEERNSGGALLGSTTYHYDNLSRMDWEERTFSTSPGSALGTYRLSYGYNVGGELQSITYPSQFGSVSVSYAYDRAGRLTAVNGSGYAGVSSYADSMTYRAFGAMKGMTYREGPGGRPLYTAYDSRGRLTKWDAYDVLGYKYYYNDFNEKTGRVTFAQKLTASTSNLDRSQTSNPEDRSYEYDHVGRLVYAHSGAEAKAHAFTGQWGTMDGAFSQGYEYDAYGNMTHRYGWGGEVQGGSPGASTDFTYAYTNNRRNGFSYDNAGNLTFDGGQHFTYDAEGRQTDVDWTDLHQYYDGDGLRVKKTENGSSYILYYLRSTVLGGQVIADINSSGGWYRGYVYAGSQLLAVQQSGVYFVHEDPVTKSKRVTDTSGAVVSVVELDPWGADTYHSANSAFQPRKFTTYERDANGTDEAMARRYNRWHSRFDQPDPYDGSYNLSDPQSFNRYAYVSNDPVNFTDPSGLTACYIDGSQSDCRSAFGIVNAGAGVFGPLHRERYNYDRGTFEFFFAAADSVGWIPRNAKFLGGFDWGWTDFSQQPPPSYTYTLNAYRAKQLFIYKGQIAERIGPHIFNVYGDLIGCPNCVGLETDWNTQMMIGGLMNGLRSLLSRGIGALIAGESEAQLGNKLDFMLGKASGSTHNLDRAGSLALQLKRIGISDSPAYRSYLTSHFRAVYSNAASVVGRQANGRIVRESLLMGPLGGAKIRSIWDGPRLITVFIFGGK